MEKIQEIMKEMTSYKPKSLNLKKKKKQKLELLENTFIQSTDNIEICKMVIMNVCENTHPNFQYSQTERRNLILNVLVRIQFIS